MIKKSIGVLPIVDNDNKPIAIERDLIKAVAHELSVNTNVIEIAQKM